jgi:hypothetical protein
LPVGRPGTPCPPRCLPGPLHRDAGSRRCLPLVAGVPTGLTLPWTGADAARSLRCPRSPPHRLRAGGGRPGCLRAAGSPPASGVRRSLHPKGLRFRGARGEPLHLQRRVRTGRSLRRWTLRQWPVRPRR